MGPPVRPHGISRQSFLVYLPDLRTWVTVAFWTSLSVASLSAMHALVSGFCSSGYDFAIPSFRLHLAVQTLGVAMGFVGNYAPRGLSPQTDGMPVIPQKRAPYPGARTKSYFTLLLFIYADDVSGDGVFAFFIFVYDDIAIIVCVSDEHLVLILGCGFA